MGVILLDFLRLTSPEMGPAVKASRHGENTRGGEIVNNTRVSCRGRSRALFAKRRIRTVGGRGTNPFGSCSRADVIGLFSMWFGNERCFRFEPFMFSVRLQLWREREMRWQPGQIAESWP